MRTSLLSLTAAAACLALAGTARSGDIFPPPPLGWPVQTCGQVVSDEICGTLLLGDNGHYYGFDGLADFGIGARLHVAGDLCFTCLLVQCGNPWNVLTGAVITPCVTGDLNFDGAVDGRDLGVLLGAWGPCDGCLADLNGDGVVDGLDIGVMLANWTG